MIAFASTLAMSRPARIMNSGVPKMLGALGCCRTGVLGLISATRGGADELELRRLMDSMHATVDTWRN